MTQNKLNWEVKKKQYFLELHSYWNLNIHMKDLHKRIWPTGYNVQKWKLFLGSS